FVEAAAPTEAGRLATAEAAGVRSELAFRRPRQAAVRRRRPMTGDTAETGAAGQRRDKWLWCARFFKSRRLANALLAAGRLRLSGAVVGKAHQKVRVGDVLTFPQGPHVRVVKVLSLAVRRGPAPEAQALYEDLAPVP